MKKTVAVIYTIMLGRKSYVTNHVISSTLQPGKKVVTFNTNLDKAKGFDNEVEAEAFRELIVNPAQRQLVVGSETIVINRKPVKATEEAP